MHVALVFDMKMSVIRSTQLSLHMYCIGCGILHKFKISRHVIKTIWIFYCVPIWGRQVGAVVILVCRRIAGVVSVDAE